MDKHSITPPPELVQQWATVNGTHYEDLATLCRQVAVQAAQWGADQELEACCAWLPQMSPWSGKDLRKHRRPKPPSLKEQALAELEILSDFVSGWGCDGSTIRRALEQLND